MKESETVHAENSTPSDDNDAESSVEEEEIQFNKIDINQPIGDTTTTSEQVSSQQSATPSSSVQTRASTHKDDSVSTCEIPNVYASQDFKHAS